MILNTEKANKTRKIMHCVKEKKIKTMLKHHAVTNKGFIAPIKDVIIDCIKNQSAFN